MHPENDETQQLPHSSDHQLPGLESTPGLTLTPQDSPPEKAPPTSENWKSCLLPVAGLVGLAVVFFAFMILYNHWSTPNDQATEGTGTTTQAPVFFATPRSSLTLPLASEVVATEDAHNIPLKSSGILAYVSFIDGEVFQSVDGSAIPLSLNDSLSSPTSLASNPDSGVYIELTDSSDSASFLYLFFESTMNLVYDTAFRPQLPDGRLYLQTGLDEAAIHFPGHHNTIAILAGSADIENPNRMLVETLEADIWIWCLSGDCTVENEQGDQTTLPTMTKSLYHPETGDIEDAIPITTEELWAWQAACAYRCLTGFAVFPTPTITTTATPTIYHTAIPTKAPTATIDPTSTRPPPPTATPTATEDPYPAPPTPTQGVYPRP
jgi:hypothetical protein